MLPVGTTTGEQMVFAVASSSITVINSAIPMFIDLGGIVLAFFAAFAIFYAVVYAGRGALKI